MPYKVATIKVLGYQPRESVPPEDYPDFRIGREFSAMEMNAMLTMGHVPPGLIVTCRGNVGIVTGHYFEKQRIDMIARAK